MTAAGDDRSEQEMRLDEVVTAYLQALEAGERPDQAAWLAQHPDLAGDLAEFFAAQKVMEGVTAPFREQGPAEPPCAEASVAYFGDYELQGEIARGGMGVVYRARQVSLNRPVALKMILAGRLASADDVQRFRLEAEAAANLDHPNIVPIYEVGEHQGQHYFSMKLIEGRNLADALPALAGDLRGAARLLATVARAVHHAHQRGVLHRDLKPANIILDAQGEPHVTDFGLARLVGADTRLTQSGAILGTPAYMAPEQATGQRGVSTAADVYALGAILYQLLTGRPAFQADTPLETVLQVREREPTRPSAVNPKIDRDLETICLKCLDKEPGKRYPSAQALADDLEHWHKGEPISARATGSVHRLVRWGRRNPAVATLMVAVTGSLCAGAAVSTFFALESKTQARQLRSHLYDAHLRLAQSAWTRSQLVRDAFWEENGQPPTSGLLVELLDGERPEHTGGIDLRGFEWHYWNRLAHYQLTPFPGRRCAAFSPDGHLLAGVALRGGNNGQPAEYLVTVWNADSREEVLSLPGHKEQISALVFSPDGRRLASASYDQTVKVWDVQTGKEVCSHRHEHFAYSVVFSPDGKRLASAAHAEDVQVWEADTGRTVTTVPAWVGQDDHAVAFSPDGKVLATTARDGGASLWAADSGKHVRSFPGHAGTGADCLVFSPDGKCLALARHGHVDTDVPKWHTVEVVIWEVESGRVVLLPQVHRDSPGLATHVQTLAYRPDGKLLALGSSDGNVELRDMATGELALSLLNNEGGGTYGLAFSPDGRRLATASNSELNVWQAHTGEPDLTLQSGHGDLWSVAFSPDARLLAAAAGRMRSQKGAYRGAVELWDARSGRLLHTLDGHTDLVRGVAFHPDGERLASASEDGSVKIWEARSGKLLNSLAPSGTPAAITFSSDGQLLAISCPGISSGGVEIRDAHDGQLVRRLGRGGSGAAFSPDGRRLCNGEGLWDVNDGSMVLGFGEEGGDGAVAFSPDGRQVAILSRVMAFQDRLVRVWDLKSRRQVRVLRGHSAAIRGLAWSPDGKRLATASEDRTVRLWDINTGQETLILQGPIQGHARAVTGVAFSADGRRLASSSHDGTVKVWDASPPPAEARRGIADLRR